MTPRLKRLYKAFRQGTFSLWVPYRTYMLLREMLRNGCFLLETSFLYQQEQFAIQTLIQPDAEVIHVLPDVKKWTDPSFVRLMETTYQHHRQRLRETLGLLNRNQAFFKMLIDLLLVGANIQPVISLLKEPDWIATSLAASTFVTSLLFRKYLRPSFLKMVFGYIFRRASGKWYQA